MENLGTRGSHPFERGIEIVGLEDRSLQRPFRHEREKGVALGLRPTTVRLEEDDADVLPWSADRRSVSLQLPFESVADKSPSQLIDERIDALGDWRGEMLSRLRSVVKEADPEVVEEWKWRGVPTWYHDGMICTGETYKDVVKMTFAKGAHLSDPAGLFNSSLEGSTRRAIDFREGEKINAKALKALVRDAVALNQSKAKR